MITLEPIWQADSQTHIARALLGGAGHPGEIRDLSRWISGGDAMIGVLATLVDGAVTCADPQGLLGSRELALIGANQVAVTEAAFVLMSGALAPPGDFTVQRGSLLAPERGATLIVRCAQLGDDGILLRLEGPGIPRLRTLACDGLHPAWIAWRDRHCADFPLGIEMVLCDRERIAVLPRTTKVSLTADHRKEF
jgi:alpha-D-ribose 1-methylphosphonate 5-triphosphate synthase subunit PhnH